MIWILIVIVSYLLGSIPSGYLVAKSHGIDIRQHGSKNIGATNVLRVMGKKWGYFVFFCDVLKGFVAGKVGFFLAGSFGATVTLAGLVAALSCILGHNYPVWLLVFLLGRYVSVASISLAVALPIAVALLGPYVRINDYWLVLCFSVLAAGLAVWRHHANITRLLNGTESRFGKKKSES